MRATLPDRAGYDRLWAAVSAFLDNVRPPRATGLEPRYHRTTDRMNADLLIDKPPSGVTAVETTVALNGVGQATVTHNAPFASDATGAKVVLPNVVGGLNPGDQWDAAAVHVSVTGLKSEPGVASFVFDVKPSAPTGLEAVYHD